MSFNDPFQAIAELQRLLHNLVRVGTVHSVDHGGQGKPATVRVSLGEIVTDWRPYHECRAGGTSTWSPPTVGEQCTVLSPSGDLGAAVVMVGLNSTSHPAPGADPNHSITRYADGATVVYDHAAHALTATLPAGGVATLVAPGNVTVDSPQTTMKGHCTVEGTLTYMGGMRGSGVAKGASSSAEIVGTVRVSEDVVAGGVSLVKHPHPGVQRGSAQTDAPSGGVA